MTKINILHVTISYIRALENILDTGDAGYNSYGTAIVQSPFKAAKDIEDSKMAAAADLPVQQQQQQQRPVVHKVKVLQPLKQQNSQVVLPSPTNGHAPRNDRGLKVLHPYNQSATPSAGQQLRPQQPQYQLMPSESVQQQQQHQQHRHPSVVQALKEVQMQLDVGTLFDTIKKEGDSSGSEDSGIMDEDEVRI
jgi:hypothetical protein